MKIYLASPFFNDDQKGVVKKLETILEDCGHEVYSPSRDGGILERFAPKSKRVKILSENIGAIRWADYVIGVIDGRDIGTIWEMGYAYGIGKKVIGYTSEGYDMNVMLTETVCSFVKSNEDLLSVLEGKRIKWEGGIQ
ncbi:MAG: nucleoside 2-deoxyribosyltransferase [Candidatus Nealsonbacteria bacterium]|nr:MAG: nucleoside 2-deoxyribosyltransferase [Candidatus Nealsonbacteria bacterium]